MIAQEQEQATCKICGTPITQKGGKGHPKRVFCDKAKCRKAASRAARKGKPPVTVGVTIDAQAHIANLEQELALSQQNLAVCQEKLSQASSRNQKLERQVEIQRQRLGQSYQAKERIAELERQVKDLEARLVSEAPVRSSKRKKADEPLPADLVYWRQFANLHGVSQNEVTEAVSRGYIHLVRGSWKVGDDYITQALDTQGRHEFWVQFHASDKFRACDTCPH